MDEQSRKAQSSGVSSQPKIIWADRPACDACGKAFWSLRRKHHCRNCGGIYCADCSSKTASVPPHYGEPTRVCDRCYAQLARHQVPAAQAGGGSLLTYLDDAEFEDKPSSSSQPISASLPPRLSETLRPSVSDQAVSASYGSGTDQPTARWLQERTTPYVSSPVAKWKSVDSSETMTSSRGSNSDSGEFQEADLDAGSSKVDVEGEQEIFAFQEDKRLDSETSATTGDPASVDREREAQKRTGKEAPSRVVVPSVQESFILLKEGEGSGNGGGGGDGCESVKIVQEKEEEEEKDKGKEKERGTGGGDMVQRNEGEAGSVSVIEEKQQQVEAPGRERDYVVRFTVFKPDEELPLFDEPVKLHFAIDATKECSLGVSVGFGAGLEVDIRDVAELRSVLSKTLLSYGLQCAPDQLQIFLRSGAMVSNQTSFFCKDNALYVRETRTIREAGQQEKTEEMVFVMPAQVKVVVNIPAQEPTSESKQAETEASTREEEEARGEVSRSRTEEEGAESSGHNLVAVEETAAPASEQAPVASNQEPALPATLEGQPSSPEIAPEASEAPQPQIEATPEPNPVGEETSEMPDQSQTEKEMQSPRLQEDSKPAPVEEKDVVVAAPTGSGFGSTTGSAPAPIISDSSHDSQSSDPESSAVDPDASTNEEPSAAIAASPPSSPTPSGSVESVSTPDIEPKEEPAGQPAAVAGASGAAVPKPNPFTWDGIAEGSSCVWAGFRDAFRLRYTKISLQRSHTVFVGTMNTLFLNLVLLLTVYLVYSYVWMPVLQWALYWKEPAGTLGFLATSFEVLIRLAFWISWMVPLYLVSVILNATWSENIAFRSYRLSLYLRKGKTPEETRSIVSLITESVYRNLIFGIPLVLSFLCNFIPYVGPVIYFVSLSLIYAVYCFEYKWTYRNHTLNQKIRYLENHWLYLFGFGLPITLLSFFFPYLISYSLVSFLFPIFIPVTMYVHPKAQRIWPPIPLSSYLDNSLLAPLLKFISKRYAESGGRYPKVLASQTPATKPATAKTATAT